VGGVRSHCKNSTSELCKLFADEYLSHQTYHRYSDVLIVGLFYSGEDIARIASGERAVDDQQLNNVELAISNIEK